MIKSKKKFILLLAMLSVTLFSAPLAANAEDNMISNDNVLSTQLEQNQYISNAGTIKNVLFFENGKYLYGGLKSVNDQAQEGLYYNSGTRERYLGDYDVSNIRVLGSKYAVVSKEGNEYLVDLSSGNIVTEETLGERLNSISYDLKDRLITTSRYGQFESNVKIKTLSSNRYMDPVYQYCAMPAEDAQGYVDNAYWFDGGLLNTGLFGFTNENGDYIDITKKANIYIYSTKLNQVCCVENYNELNEETGLQVKLYGQAKALCEDENYIYVMVGVNIKDNNMPNNSQNSTVYSFIQKISKAAGEEVDGACLPQSVESYEVTSQYKVDNAVDEDSAYKTAILSSVKDTDFNRAPFNASCTVKDGYLYITQINQGKNKVKVNKIKLAEENVHYTPAGMKLAGSMDIGYRTQAWEGLQGENSFTAKVAEIVAQSEAQDITEFTNYMPVSVSTFQMIAMISGFGSAPNVFPDMPVGTVTCDNEGNIWALNNGQIMKYSDEENRFVVVYNCEETMNKIKVYDENNLMVWNEAENKYSVIKDGEFKEDTEGVPGEGEGEEGRPIGQVTVDGIVFDIYPDYAEAVDYNGWVPEIDIPQTVEFEGQEYTVKSIGDNAFDYSYSVKKIKMPNTITSIGKEAFLGCQCLEDIKLSENITSIPDRVFKECRALRTINIGHAVTSIGENAFDTCEALEKVLLGNRVNTIAKQAFRGCTTLNMVNMKDSVTEIGVGAFEDCHSLTKLNLSKNLAVINDDTFKNCRTITKITIPNRITSIGNGAFSGCHSLTQLSFPSSVTTIGTSIVSECRSLINTTIPSSVTNIYEGAFENCNENESSKFYVGNDYIRNSLIRDGISEYKIKPIRSGGGGSSSSHDRDDNDEKDQQQEQQEQQGQQQEQQQGTEKPDKEKISEGWKQNTEGKWLYYDKNGEKLKGKWLLDNKNWYYLNEDGYMAVGWVKLNGTWYYLNNGGSMQTGWLFDQGQWYYLTNDGSMKIGWINTGDNWYYLSENGSMLYNTYVDGYYLDETGAWVR